METDLSNNANNDTSHPSSSASQFYVLNEHDVLTYDDIAPTYLHTVNDVSSDLHYNPAPYHQPSSQQQTTREVITKLLTLKSSLYHALEHAYDDNDSNAAEPMQLRHVKHEHERSTSVDQQDDTIAASHNRDINDDIENDASTLLSTWQSIKSTLQQPDYDVNKHINTLYGFPSAAASASRDTKQQQQQRTTLTHTYTPLSIYLDNTHTANEFTHVAIKELEATSRDAAQSSQWQLKPLTTLQSSSQYSACLNVFNEVIANTRNYYRHVILPSAGTAVATSTTPSLHLIIKPIYQTTSSSTSPSCIEAIEFVIPLIMRCYIQFTPLSHSRTQTSPTPYLQLHRIAIGMYNEHVSSAYVQSSNDLYNQIQAYATSVLHECLHKHMHDTGAVSDVSVSNQMQCLYALQSYLMWLCSYTSIHRQACAHCHKVLQCDAANDTAYPSTQQLMLPVIRVYEHHKQRQTAANDDSDQKSSTADVLKLPHAYHKSCYLKV